MKFIFSNPPTNFKGEDGKVTGVSLQDETTLGADVVVLGVGKCNIHNT